MKKFNLFMIALISMFAFSLGVNAKDVATQQDFIDAMTAGGDVKVTENIEVTSVVVVNKDVNLDLNGHEVKFAENKYIQLEKGKLSILGEGKMYEASPYYAPIYIASSASETDTSYVSLSVGKDVTLEGCSGIFIKYKNNPTAYGVTVDLYGTINAVDDRDGYNGAGIYVNGNITKEVNAPVINVHEGAVINSTGIGIFGAGYANYNILGGKITGTSSGIEVRAGKLNVTGGEIVSTATSINVTPNGNGATTDGVAVAVMQHTTKLPLEVSITGGTLKGFTALYQANIQKNDEEAVTKVKLSITGGTFTSTDTSDDAVVVYSENKEGFITGGTYNTDLEEEYLKDNFATTEPTDGKFVVLNFEGFYNWLATILDLDEDDYTEASLKALEDYADSIEEPSTQEELDAIVAKLTELTNALETPEEEKARLEKEEAEKKANEDKKTNNPDTGDNIYLYVGILTISILTIGALVLNRRKSYR